ncbi:MAG: hypothetical protein ACOCXG_05830 [Nanoarchaeota archaeon]
MKKTNHIYQIDWIQKKTMFVKAKNKAEARKKAKDKIGKGRTYFKIDYVTENDNGFFY